MKEVVCPRNSGNSGMYVSYIIIVISVWSYGYSNCSETNVDINERTNVVGR